MKKSNHEFPGRPALLLSFEQNTETPPVVPMNVSMTFFIRELMQIIESESFFKRHSFVSGLTRELEPWHNCVTDQPETERAKCK